MQCDAKSKRDITQQGDQSSLHKGSIAIRCTLRRHAALGQRSNWDIQASRPPLSEGTRPGTSVYRLERRKLEMKVNNNENEEGTAQSAVEDCRILERQFAYGLAQISSLFVGLFVIDDNRLNKRGILRA